MRTNRQEVRSLASRFVCNTSRQITRSSSNPPIFKKTLENLPQFLIRDGLVLVEWRQECPPAIRYGGAHVSGSEQEEKVQLRFVVKHFDWVQLRRGVV